ncbi:MAG: DMT family transporter [Gammaproteobacteria bacterium]|nr:DMT family transporter [Gammaproteobacteria bacterium]MYD76588.1 DMT family transporter [Gammaproteobacteria bacterium]MYJ51782.1 DMT family transporter [Gammaproteobacteria bacterium]
MKGPSDVRLSGILLALTAAMAYGAVTTQAKIVYTAGGNALTLMFWRYLVASVVIASVLKLARQPLGPKSGITLRIVLISVVFSGSMISYLKSVETISVSLAVLLLYIFPILVMLTALVTGRMRPSIISIGAFFMAFLGIGLLLGGDDLEGGLTGILFAVLAACGFAYTFLKGSDLAPGTGSLVLSLWVNLAGLCLVVPMVYGEFAMPDGQIALLCLVGATLSYIVAVLAHFATLARLSAARAAFIFNLEPVVSLLLAMLVLSESLGTVQWMGVGLILALLPLFNILYKPLDGKPHAP